MGRFQLGVLGARFFPSLFFPWAFPLIALLPTFAAGTVLYRASVPEVDDGMGERSKPGRK